MTMRRRGGFIRMSASFMMQHDLPIRIIQPHKVASPRLNPSRSPRRPWPRWRDVWLEVRRLPELSVVSVIEVLSPSNKIGDGYWEYMARRQAVLGRPVNLVEIDLLIGGRRMALKAPQTHYTVLISRADRRETVDVYGWGLRDPLPVVPVPLRWPDPDISVDLGEVFDTAYSRGRYDRAVRYEGLPAAGLEESDAAWASKLLTAQTNAT